MENSVNDLVIRIKNGYMAKKETITSPYSKFREQVALKLKAIGFIKNVKIDNKDKKTITIDLKYENKEGAFTDVTIFSKPGRRYYVSYKDLKTVVSGFGYSILSTPIGILTDREAKVKKVGGELLFNIW